MCVCVVVESTIWIGVEVLGSRAVVRFCSKPFAIEGKSHTKTSGKKKLEKDDVKPEKFQFAFFHLLSQSRGFLIDLARPMS